MGLRARSKGLGKKKENGKLNLPQRRKVDVKEKGNNFLHGTCAIMRLCSMVDIPQPFIITTRTIHHNHPS